MVESTLVTLLVVSHFRVKCSDPLFGSSWTLTSGKCSPGACVVKHESHE